MSEAELHILRARMYQARLSKARRGEVYYHPPIGYTKRSTGEFEIDADQQVQDVVRMIFDKFDELGTIGAVLRYMVRQGIRVGVRPASGPDRGQLQWRPPCRYTLHNMLHNPTYAGAYAHGRRPVDPRRKVPGRPGTGRTTAALTQWEVLIPDHMPAYITWDRFLANRRRLSENQSRYMAVGAPRRGAALLAGLLSCGRCGQRMMVGYCKGGRPFYFCHRLAMNYGGPACQRIAAVALDDLIGREVLRAVEPAALDLALQAAGDLKCERERLERHWRQQLDRARHDVDRVARQYHAVDPENRLVASELERRWEQALSEQRDLQDQYDRFASQRPRELADVDRELIGSLSADLPRLWRAETTTVVDRKLIVRHLVERIVVDVRGSSEMVDVEVRWAGGHASHHEARRPINNYERLHNFALLKERVTTLRREGRTAGRIAEVLNGEGFLPPKGPARYDRILVQKLMRICGLQGSLLREFHGDVALREDEWWLGDLAKELAISRQMLRRWADRGLVGGRRDATRLRRWILWANAQELDRLRQLAAGRPRAGKEIPIRAGSIGDGAHRIETPALDGKGRSQTPLPSGA